MVSEEGRRYKIPLQALLWRNSEPKSVERLKRKIRGEEKESEDRKAKGRKPLKKPRRRPSAERRQRPTHLQKHLRR